MPFLPKTAGISGISRGISKFYSLRRDAEQAEKQLMINLYGTVMIDAMKTHNQFSLEQRKMQAKAKSDETTRADLLAWRQTLSDQAEAQLDIDRDKNEIARQKAIAGAAGDAATQTQKDLKSLLGGDITAAEIGARGERLEERFEFEEEQFLGGTQTKIAQLERYYDLFQDHFTKQELDAVKANQEGLEKGSPEYEAAQVRIDDLQTTYDEQKERLGEQRKNIAKLTKDVETNLLGALLRAGTKKPINRDIAFDIIGVNREDYALALSQGRFESDILDPLITELEEDVRFRAGVDTQRTGIPIGPREAHLAQATAEAAGVAAGGFTSAPSISAEGGFRGPLATLDIPGADILKDPLAREQLRALMDTGMTAQEASTIFSGGRAEGVLFSSAAEKERKLHDAEQIARDKRAINAELELQAQIREMLFQVPTSVPGAKEF